MKIVVTNIHSAANLGDAVLLQRSLLLLETAFPAAEVTLTADFPQTVRSRFPRSTVVSSLWADWYQPQARPAWLRHLFLLWLLPAALLARIRLPARLLPLPAATRRLLSALQSADLVVTVAGGSLIAAAPQHLPGGYFTFLTAPIWLALLIGRPLAMLPATYGPFASPLTQWLAIALMRRARLLCARSSADTWPFAAVSAVLHSADLAVGLPLQADDHVRAAQLLARAGLAPNVRPIAIVAHDWRSQHGSFHGQAEFEQLLRQLLDDLTSRGLTVLLIPQAGGPLPLADDRHVLRRIAVRARFPARVILLDLPPDGATAQALYARAAALLTSRLHAAIFALNAGVPVLALSYQRKAADVLVQYGLADAAIRLETATLPLLRDRLLTCLSAPLPLSAAVYLRRARDEWPILVTALRRAAGRPAEYH